MSNLIINFYSVPPLVCSFIAVSIGILAFVKKPTSDVNRNFFFSSIATFFWLSFYGINFTLSSNIIDSNLIRLIYRLAYCGVSYIPIFYFAYSCAFLELEWAKSWRIFNHIYGIVMIVLIIKTDLIISGIKQYFWGYYPIAGRLHPVFLAYFLLLIMMSNFLLLRQLLTRQNPENKTNKLRYIAFGFIVYTFACLDFIPNYGIEIYPMGYLFTTVYISIFCYAIVKYQLMDISIVIKRSIIYSILITVVTMIFLVAVLISEKFFEGVFGYKNILLSILTAVFIAIIFNPLKNRLQGFVDRLFFKGTPIEIAEQNEILLKELTRFERLRALSTFASGMAHEIKNPLTAIKTFTEYLPARQNDPKFMADFARIVGSEVDRIDGLVHELLDFAKQQKPNLKPTDIHALLNGVIEFVNNELTRHKITLVTKFHPEKVILNIDGNQFRQVFLNLILNAVEAMPSGGVLTVGTSVDGVGFSGVSGISGISGISGNKTHSTNSHSDSKIVKPLTSTNYLSISITDTGCGIPEASLTKIFEPFFTSKDTGTGLGLVVVKQIIEAHEGKIGVKSEVGKGTVFTIEMKNVAMV